MLHQCQARGRFTPAAVDDDDRAGMMAMRVRDIVIGESLQMMTADWHYLPVGRKIWPHHGRGQILFTTI